VTDDTVFGREVEKLCGADQALQSRDGPHALSPDWAMQHATPASEDGAMTCLLKRDLGHRVQDGLHRQ